LCSFGPLSFAGNGSSIGLHGSIGVAHVGYSLAVLHSQKKPHQPRRPHREKARVNSTTAIWSIKGKTALKA
jgi:hypothetical protein